MSVGRRELLRGLGGLAAYAWLPSAGGCSSDDDSPGADPEAATPLSAPAFLHGVASGDPLPDGVLLWTRITPVGGEPLVVQWQIAQDEAFTRVVDSGDVTTDAKRDYTIKVEPQGLEAATPYYYRFQCDDAQSPIGRTRTAPEGDVDRLRFAVVSCSSYAHGYFHVYRAISKREDLEAVIHLGDYIYEYGNGEYGEARTYDPPHEILTLDDYRRRYAYYRRDADLQAVHQQLPMIAIWDDHEVANNSWIGGAENHNPDKGEGDFATRKAAAVLAYREWMPIREGEGGRTFRTLAYGNLVDLILLDTRNWGRTQQAMSADQSDFASDARTLLGADQEAWLSTAMDESSARWRLIAQQVMVGPFAFYLNLDDWSGYPAARERFLTLLETHSAKDTVVLTGDVHSSWAMNVLRGDTSLSVEIVAPGITSPGIDQASAEALYPMLMTAPHVKYVDLWRRGYVLLDVDAERVEASWYLYADVIDPQPPPEQLGHVASVYAGERRLREPA